MSDTWYSAVVGAGVSLTILLAEVAVILAVNRSNSKNATVLALGVFGVAFLVRMVLLLAGKQLRLWGLNDEFSFGLGVIGGFLVGVAGEALLWTTTRRKQQQ